MKIVILLLVLLLVVLPACGPTGSDTVGEVPATPDTPTTAATTAVPEPTDEPAATPTEEAAATPTEERTATPTEELQSTATPTAAASPTPARSPGTTPDGIAIRPDLDGTIAFVRDGNIYAYQPQTGEVSQFIENGRDMQFSHDGTQIAFMRDDGLYLAAADGSDIRQIVEQSNLLRPRWTDDGSKIVFERVLDPATPGRSEIWTVELPNGEPIKIADGADPAWAPDGLRVAYVTGPTGQPQRNQLRLVNWRGENGWTVVSDLPEGTPPIGGIEKVPPENLSHRMLAPVWDAKGAAIYVPSFVLYQALTGFSIWERADATNGGSIFLSELPEVGNAVGSPDRQAVIFTTLSARGDVGLIARALGADVGDEQYAWAETEEVAVHQAPTWSPSSDAIAVFRCPLGGEPTACDLVLLEDGQDKPAVLIPDAVAVEALARERGFLLAWGQ